jgi:general secretion pathway protein A
MYLDFYELKVKPFQISTDSRFLWLGEKHKEALATLKYGILDNKGFLLLTGDVGTGKTTLINALASQLGDNVLVATLPDPNLEPLDFYNFVADAFQLDTVFATKGAFLIRFTQFLHQTYSRNQKVLLIVDEAQRLQYDILEEIRLLSNIERQETKLLNIFFVGQSEFNDTLLKRENRALRQRITLNYNIGPLDEKETGQYIRHRLQVAGREGKIFDAGAVRGIHEFSGGYPRLINIICDLALLTGYVEEAKTIGPQIIRECARELEIKSHAPAPDPAQAPPAAPPVAESVDPARVAAPAAAPPAPLPRAGWSPLDRFIGLVVLALLIFITVLFLQDRRASYNGRRDVLAPPVAGVGREAVVGENTPSAAPHRPAAPAGAVAAPSPAPAQAPAASDQQPALRGDAGGADSSVGAPPAEPPAPVAAPPASSLPAPPEKIRVFFMYNSNEMSAEAYTTLDQAAMLLARDPGLRVTIRGYTDNAGAASYNTWLSKFRAEIVKSYLVGKGVEAERIEAIGMGPADPVATNATPEGRGANRRVELEFVGSPAG